MEKVGVEAIVENLTAFQGDMKKMDKSISGVGVSGLKLGDIFRGIGNIISGLISGVFRVLEYTLGNLLADAIEGVIGFLRDMASGAMESADEFQKLEIRLQRLNFNAARDSGKEYNAAMEESIRLTKEQLDWTMRLGAMTPYDARDIANIYTLARGYGFSADEAKSLTDSTIQFTAGMGLSNEEMERIIINFGQLRQQGKLNSQDLRDLARGSFVPINKVLEMTAEKLGLTTEEFNKQKKAGTLSAEAVDVFRQSFQELVGVDFEGAAQALGNVFSVAQENVKGLIRDTLGLYVLKPLLLSIGSRIQEITDAITEDDSMWNRLSTSIQRIGNTILQILGQFMDVDTSAVAEGIVGTFERVAGWLEQNSSNIVVIIQGWLDTLAKLKDWAFGTPEQTGAIQKLVDWINTVVIPTIDKISTWVNKNKELINQFFTTLGEIVSEIFSDITGQPGKPEGGGGILESIKNFMQFVVDHKDGITKFIEILWSAFAVFTVISVIMDVTTKIVMGLVAAFLAGAAILHFFQLAIEGVGIILLAIFSPAGLAVISIIVLLIAQIAIAIAFFTFWKNMALAAIDGIKAGFQVFLKIVTTTIQNVRDAFMRGDWVGAGRYIIQGITAGINAMISTLIYAAYKAAMAVYDTIRDTLGIHSRSTVFMEIGEFSMKGMAEGIKKFSGLASNAMAQAANQMVMSAMAPQAITNTYQTSNQFNLNINSSANTEPVIQDFNMMQSLVGG